MTFDPTLLSTLVLVATGFAAAFFAALWLSLIIWTYRDIRRRARDPLARILAVLVVAVLFLPGHPGLFYPAPVTRRWKRNSSKAWKKKPCSSPSRITRYARAADGACAKIGWPAPAATPA